MARPGPAGGEDHGPGHVADLAPELAVDEIAHAAPEQALRHQGRDEVRDFEEGLLAGAREIPEGAEHAQQAAVEGHAAVPDAQYLAGVVDIGGQVVEEHIAQARAQDDAQHDEGQQVVHIHGLPAGTGAGGPPAGQAPAHEKGQQVHEAVPAQLQGADAEGHGIDGRELHPSQSRGLAWKAPLRPPSLNSRRTRLMTMSRCTALHMS